MEKITPASSTIIPTVDLSPFMDSGDETCRKMVIDTISEACKNLGVFQITNHGDSFDQCEKLLELSKTFFSYSDEVKENSTHDHCHKSGAGYGKADDKYHDYEYILMYSPDQHANGVPTIQDDYRETYEEVFKYFVKTSQILEEIINDSLGLPSNFLKNYNNDRCWDYMLPMYYTPSNETEKIGIDEHEDPNMITIVLQDDVSGLVFFKDGEWIPLIPKKGTLVVIVSDLIQVLSNKKVTHVTHKAFKNKGSKRLAIDFCYNFAPNKSVYPLPQLIEEGDTPKYREFKYKEYIDLIMKDMKNPPSRVEDFKDITYFEIKRYMS